MSKTDLLSTEGFPGTSQTKQGPTEHGPTEQGPTKHGPAEQAGATQFVKRPPLPYVDFILTEMAAGNVAVQQAWGSHMHWGYWEAEQSPDVSLAGYTRAAEAMSRRHLDSITLVPGMRVADVGCGLGGTLELLNRHYEGLDLVGVNIDRRQIDYARSRVLPREGSANTVTFIEADACQLPFEDQSLDLILSIECIFHFSSRARYFAEVRRVLKPGGRIVFSDFVAASWSLPLVILLYLPFQKGVRRSYGEAGMPPTRKLYRRLAKQNNLRPIALDDVTANTLPNYRALLPLVTGTPVEKDFRAGLKFLELATRAGFYTYDLFTFEAS